MCKNIDLTYVKSGDLLEFAAGGKGIVHKIRPIKTTTPLCAEEFDVVFQCDEHTHLPFYANGKSLFSRLLDITAVLEPPFNWDNVKVGMAFERRKSFERNKTYFYVGKNPFTSNIWRVFSTPEGQLKEMQCEYLFRVPEKDV
jgi:hypothetical protein